jgi:hypothetical protein
VELLTMKQKREQRELVAFITTQAGDDLVISFAVCKPDDPTDIESLTILRTPKYEVFLYEWERGASVSFGRDLQGDERVLLREVVYASGDKCITLRTGHEPGPRITMSGTVCFAKSRFWNMIPNKIQSRRLGA